MEIGTVKEKLTAGKRATCLEGQTLLLIRTENALVAALDHVGASVGDRVLVVTGGAAEKYSMEAVTDAAVVAVVGTSGGCCCG